MWATKLANNSYLVLANRLAPIISASILSAYAFFGKRVEVVKPIGDNKEPILHFVGMREHIRRFGGSSL